MATECFVVYSPEGIGGESGTSTTIQNTTEVMNEMPSLGL